MHKIFVPAVPTVPCPLLRLSPKPKARPPTTAPARSRSPQPKRMPTRRPEPQAASSSGAGAPAEIIDVEAPVPEVIIDLEAPVHCPQSAVSAHATARADADLARDKSPSPTRGRRLAWTCEGCGNLNNRTYTVCSRVGCGKRLPWLQRAGDWPCLDCGHMNRAWRDRCNWSHCPSNDWVCPACGNLNFGDRRFCNRKSPPCSEPRPRSLE